MAPEESTNGQNVMVCLLWFLLMVMTDVRREIILMGVLLYVTETNANWFFSRDFNHQRCLSVVNNASGGR